MFNSLFKKSLGNDVYDDLRPRLPQIVYWKRKIRDRSNDSQERIEIMDINLLVNFLRHVKTDLIPLNISNLIGFE